MLGRDQSVGHHRAFASAGPRDLGGSGSQRAQRAYEVKLKTKKSLFDWIETLNLNVVIENIKVI